MKEKLHELHSLAEGSPMTDASSEKMTCSGSLELGEQGKGFSSRLFIFFLSKQLSTYFLNLFPQIQN